MTVSILARATGLSRTAVLYYESIGLLRPPSRSSGNYRVYGKKDLRVLQQICAYRAAGLTLEDIRTILHQPRSDFTAILQKRLVRIGEEADRLREHQHAIAGLLRSGGQPDKGATMTKQKWVKIMQNSGLSDEGMHSWHARFERTAPEEHEESLRFLHIPDAEVKSIRDWSRCFRRE